MKKLIIQIKRNILGFCLKTFSLSAMMFIFQACYGSMQEVPSTERAVSIKILSKVDGKPIPNIHVDVNRQHFSTSSSSNEQGNVRFYLENLQTYVLKFSDIDGNTNGGNFASKDTSISITDSGNTFEIFLEKL